MVRGQRNKVSWPTQASRRDQTSLSKQAPLPNRPKRTKSIMALVSTLLLALMMSLSACSSSSGATLSTQQVLDRWQRLCSEQSAEEKIEKWEEDLDYLVAQLEKRHKNLYHKISKEDFAAAAAKLRDQLPHLDDAGRFIEFMKLVAKVGDAHTSVPYAIPLHWFPMQVYWFKEGIYVIAADEKYEGILGKRLVGIGGVGIEEIFENLTPVIAHENETMLKIGFVYAIRCAEILKHHGYVGSVNEGDFEFEDADGNRETVRMTSSLNSAGFNIVRLEDRLDRSTPMLSKQHPGELYWYEYVESDKMLYFQYNACIEDKNKPVSKLTQEVMEIVDSHDVDKFVFDLRNNGGGNSQVIQPLLTALAKSEKINRKGHLFAVIGRYTFSSAILNALWLKNETEAIFIGEPTGGRPNHFGEVRSFNLPNSGISVRYSTKYFRFSEDDSESLIPDILVEPSFADFVSNRDAVIERIKAMSGKTPN